MSNSFIWYIVIILPLKVREMMEKYITFTILLLLSILSDFFVDNPRQAQVSVHNESNILDSQNPYDSYPIENDDPHKIIHFTLISSILIILSLTTSNTFLINSTRRKILLLPIFYQSNYVKIPLLSK